MKGRISAIKERRNLPFLKIGMRVEINGEIGKIVGEDPNLNLMVDFDGIIKYKNAKVNIKYFDKKGNVIAKY